MGIESSKVTIESQPGQPASDGVMAGPVIVEAAEVVDAASKMLKNAVPDSHPASTRYDLGRALEEAVRKALQGEQAELVLVSERLRPGFRPDLRFRVTRGDNAAVQLALVVQTDQPTTGPSSKGKNAELPQGIIQAPALNFGLFFIQQFQEYPSDPRGITRAEIMDGSGVKRTTFIRYVDLFANAGFLNRHQAGNQITWQLTEAGAEYFVELLVANKVITLVNTTREPELHGANDADLVRIPEFEVLIPLEALKQLSPRQINMLTRLSIGPLSIASADSEQSSSSSRDKNRALLSKLEELGFATALQSFNDSNGPGNYDNLPWEITNSGREFLAEHKLLPPLSDSN